MRAEGSKQEHQVICDNQNSSHAFIKNFLSPFDIISTCLFFFSYYFKKSITENSEKITIRPKTVMTQIPRSFVGCLRFRFSLQLPVYLSSRVFFTGTVTKKLHTAHVLRGTFKNVIELPNIN